MIPLVLGLRFLLELVGLAAAAYAGYRLAGEGIGGIVIGAGAAAGVAIVWGLFIAPRADSPLPVELRPLVGSMVLLVVAAALAWAGELPPAGLFAAAVVVDTVAIYLLGAQAS